MRNVLQHELFADNLADLYAHRVLHDPDLVFIKFEDRVMTYSEFDRCVARLRDGLTAQGLEPGTIVAAFMENSPALLALLLACAQQGLVWAPMSPVSKRRDLAYTLADTGPGMVFVDDGLSGLLAEVMAGSSVPLVVVGGRGLLPDALDDDRVSVPQDGWSLPEWTGAALRDPSGPSDYHRAPAVTARDVLCIIYSGGTTGMPKGIVIPHFYAISAALRLHEMADFGDDECVFTSLQLFHSWVPLTILPFCMYYRHPMAFTRWWSASTFLDNAIRFSATVVDLPISMLATLLKQPDEGRQQEHRAWLLVAALGGADPACVAMVEEFEKRFGIRTLQMYALTEAGPLAITEHASEPRRRGSSGTARGWYEVEIADEEGMQCPPGQRGEILLRPRIPNIMALGYHNKQAQTVATWRDLWIHTGDEGYLDADGYLYFVGRKDFFLRRRGEVVSIAEVEAVLMDCPGVEDAAVVAVASELGEDDIKACVVAAPGTSAEAIYRYCLDELSYYKVPRYIELLRELPRSATKREPERHRLGGLDPQRVWDGGPRRAPADATVHPTASLQQE